MISASLNVADRTLQVHDSLPVQDRYSTAFEIGNDSTNHGDDFNVPSPKRMALDKDKGPAKGVCQPKVVVAEVSILCLPIPCPLPSNFSPKVISACENGQLVGNMKFAFLREAATLSYAQNLLKQNMERWPKLCVRNTQVYWTKEQLMETTPLGNKLNNRM